MDQREPKGRYSRSRRAKLLNLDITAYLPDIQEVVQSMDTARMSSSTLKGYEDYLKLFASWLVLTCDSRNFREVRIEDLRNFIEFLTNDQCLAPNTLNAYLAAIRKMYAVIRNEDLNKRILPDLVVDTHVPIVPSVTEVARMLKACKLSIETLLIAVLITTGMRISEAACMRFRDVEKAQKRIFVPYSKGHIAGYVPLSQQVISALTTYCNEYNSAHPSQRLTPDDYVFFNKDRSDHMSSSQLRTIYNRIQKRAGLQDRHYTFHTLRHYFGLNMYLQSHDLVLVKSLLRHKTVAATLVYVILAASFDAQKLYRNPGDMAFEMNETGGTDGTNA